MNIRFWIATALLAGSWLFGRYYFYPGDAWVWLASVVTAVLLLGHDSHARATWRFEGLALVLLLPAVWLSAVAVSGRAAATRRRVGVAIVAHARAVDQLVGRRRRGGRSGDVRSSVLSGGVHRPDRRIARPALAVARRVGWNRKIAGVSTPRPTGITSQCTRCAQTHRLAATWELLLDPQRCCFSLAR